MLVAIVPCALVLAVFMAAGGEVETDFSSETLGLIVMMACLSVGLSSVLWLWTGRIVGVTVAAMPP